MVFEARLYAQESFTVQYVEHTASMWQLAEITTSMRLQVCTPPWILFSGMLISTELDSEGEDTFLYVH